LAHDAGVIDALGKRKLGKRQSHRQRPNLA
jgi:hypothetical protein